MTNVSQPNSANSISPYQFQEIIRNSFDLGDVPELSAEFVNDLGLDSVDALELIAIVEEIVGKSVSDALVLMHLQTLGDVWKLIERLSSSPKVDSILP